MEILGWIMALCFISCGIPLAMDAIQNGHSRGVSRAFLWLWATGLTGGVIYATHLSSWPLLGNYLANLIECGIVLKFSYFPRN